MRTIAAMLLVLATVESAWPAAAPPVRQNPQQEADLSVGNSGVRSAPLFRPETMVLPRPPVVVPATPILPPPLIMAPPAGKDRFLRCKNRC
jgi:hypothetical protein